jgi:hypothetical protein
MSAPKTAALPMVALLDVTRVQYLLYGLAYAKTLATMSTVSYRYDYLTSGEASAVSYGDNFDQATFRRWVREEYKNQIGRMLKASEKAKFGEWMDKQWAIRQKFFRGYQETVAELGALNQRLGDLQLVGARLSAEALFAAQVALVGLGVAPQLATAAAASMVGWSAIQTAAGKLALGLGTGLAITVAQNWSSAQNADIVLIGEACASEDSKKSAVDGLKSGIPGLIDDLLAPALHSQNESLMKQYTQELDRLKRVARSGKPSKVANAQAFEKAGPKPATGGKAVSSSAMKGLGYLFSAKSLFDASSTFVKQWNGQL